MKRQKFAPQKPTKQDVAGLPQANQRVDISEFRPLESSHTYPDSSTDIGEELGEFLAMHRAALWTWLRRGLDHRASQASANAPRAEEKRSRPSERRLTKTIESIDGKARVRFYERTDGHVDFVGEAELEKDGYVYWGPTGSSGIYDSLETAERGARAVLPWLKEASSNWASHHIFGPSPARDLRMHGRTPCRR